MKIKKLTLHNIASIEEAEIDFANGLNDAITGDPASIFLISGDTGAGKSVILDGISMALYKTTPRIGSVAGKVRNEYTNNEGESVSVNSLEQYTRLGISPDAPCYSEVVFDGNDGIEYHAKLTLGVYLGKTDSTGKRPLKHRSPEWSVMRDGKNWEKVEPKSGEPIRSAVGLSFEQFSRMAMLAQGQFASFLTGDKKERETILEKLTNTEHFSEYGEAISSLYKKAEKRKDAAQTEYDTINNLLTDTEDTENQKQELEKANTEKQGKEKEKKTLDEKMGNIKEIEDNKTKISNFQNNLVSLKEKYRQLYSDLRSRTKTCEEFKDKLKEPTQWLEERKKLRPLYEQAGVVCLNLENLKKAQKRKIDADTEKKKLESLTKGLSDELEKKKNYEEESKKKVQEKQKEIDELNQKREQLKPKEINDALVADNARQGKLKTLKQDLQQLSLDTAAADKQRDEIVQEEDNLKALFEKKGTADNDYNTAKEASDKAASRLLTMKMSVGETLVALRKRLADEHTETCPLCGQHIKELHLDEEFRTFVTPLEKEKEEADKKLKDAETKRNEANENYSTANGKLTSKKELQKTSTEKNKNEKDRLDNVASKLGLDTGKALPPQIEAELQRLDNKISDLTKKQEDAESILGDINRLQKEKEPLDNDLTQKNDERQKAKNALEKNENDIKHQEVNIQNADKEINDLLGKLKPQLDGIRPEWEKNLDETCETLKNKADEYLEKEKNLRKESERFEAMNGEKDRIVKTQNELLDLCPDWKEMAVEAMSYPCSNIEFQWTNLYASCKSAKDGIQTATKTVAEKLKLMGVATEDELPDKTVLNEESERLTKELQDLGEKIGIIKGKIDTINEKIDSRNKAKSKLDKEKEVYEKWYRLNSIFGGTHFRTLVQTYILQPLLKNANIYLRMITDRYTLTCCEDNEQLSILVQDNYNQGQLRSATVLSGGERFMISLALSLALSSLNRPDMNVDILFIDEGFGTLDEKNLDSVMSTLEKLQEIAGQSNRRVGLISHREEIEERIPVQIHVKKRGQGRSSVEIIH